MKAALQILKSRVNVHTLSQTSQSLRLEAPKHTVCVGAGIEGMLSVWEYAKHWKNSRQAVPQITVIDKHSDAAQDTSYANGGTLQKERRRLYQIHIIMIKEAKHFQKVGWYRLGGA